MTAPMQTALLWLLGIATVALLLQVQRLLAPLHPHYLRLQFSPSREAFQRIVSAWGPEGVNRYQAHFRWSFAMLACCAAFGYLLATGPWFSAGLTPVADRALAALLPFAALYGAAENIIHQCIIRGTRQHPEALFPVVTVVSLLKWLLLVSFAAAIAARASGLLPGT